MYMQDKAVAHTKTHEDGEGVKKFKSEVGAENLEPNPLLMPSVSLPCFPASCGERGEGEKVTAEHVEAAAQKVLQSELPATESSEPLVCFADILLVGLQPELINPEAIAKLQCTSVRAREALHQQVVWSCCIGHALPSFSIEPTLFEQTASEICNIMSLYKNLLDVELARNIHVPLRSAQEVKRLSNLLRRARSVRDEHVATQGAGACVLLARFDFSNSEELLQALNNRNPHKYPPAHRPHLPAPPVGSTPAVFDKVDNAGETKICLGWLEGSPYLKVNSDNIFGDLQIDVSAVSINTALRSQDTRVSPTGRWESLGTTKFLGQKKAIVQEMQAGLLCVLVVRWGNLSQASVGQRNATPTAHALSLDLPRSAWNQ